MFSIAKDPFITIELILAQHRIQTVARALDAGTRGQRIRAKNESTGQTYTVMITAPAAGLVINEQQLTRTDQ